MTAAVLDTSAPAPETGLTDDDFDLDVQVVISETGFGAFNCPTSDGCGDTCANGASSCVSSIEDAG
ncbi:FxLD family lanthipeptide [Streptomyces sp. ISL-12]|uniref:FxLD family lanthipeptide n=1 Tax=Streptomyces sp. ISL-12 TaxID=2819177 RepID=UPI001BE8418B|nr:FxLD family lanthipeptide [Streptomyces sp. ISL-12]MBT2412073.1 FxLD family lanthipeptide [Streptomyces sp. ISL-12]